MSSRPPRISSDAGPFDSEGRGWVPRARIPEAAGVLDDGSGFSATETLSGKNIVLVGGTGFLGKVCVSLLLSRFPDIGHIFLMVRAKGGLTPHERFMQEQWPSPGYDTVREGKSEDEALAFLKGKLTAIAGDVTHPLGGVDDDTLAVLKSRGIHAVVNVAGVVSFTPAIDEAFNVNAGGIMNLVGLSLALSGLDENASPEERAKAIPVMHTSTCFVAGRRAGVVHEEDPRIVPFPRVNELGADFWDPRREMKEGLLEAANIKALKDDAQYQAQFMRDAKSALEAKGRPTSGEALERARDKAEKRFIHSKLVEAGTRRSEHWGWVNSYTYTKAIGEQLLCDAGVPCCIVRPAVVESALAFPEPGWNEGINTSAPLVYMALHGQVRYPTVDGQLLDVIPVDHVCFGTVLALCALLRGEQKLVYQFGTSDSNGFTMNRLIELTGLYKRKFMRSRNRGNPLLNRMLARVEPVSVSPGNYQSLSAPAMNRAAKAIKSASAMLKGTPLHPLQKALVAPLTTVEKQTAGADMVMNAFMPFISELNYRFRCDNTRALYRRLNDDEKELLPFTPDQLDWRAYWQDVHIRGLRKWVFPHLEARLLRVPRAEERFSDLLSFLDEVCRREGTRAALQRIKPGATAADEAEGVEAVSYRDLLRAVQQCASRLADAGVHPGDKVGLVARNDPRWAIGLFGALFCGATVVPLDPNLEEGDIEARLLQAGAKVCLLGPDKDGAGEVAGLDLVEFTEIPEARAAVDVPEVLVSPDDVALIVFSERTADGAADDADGDPVHMTHRNLTTLLASVAPLFQLRRRDSGLSVMPLHQPFEFLCGLLLPLLRGARVTFVDEPTSDKLAEAFRAAGITAMIGVPQVWQDLESQIVKDLKNAGPFAESAFEAGLFLNKTLGRALGMNLGRVLFRPIHERLGGNVRLLMSTGAGVPKRTAGLFRSLGFELHESYGLQGGAPVVSLSTPGQGQKPLPGVQLEVRDVGDDGVGEIVTKTPEGFLPESALNADALAGDDGRDRSSEGGGLTLGRDGWLRTGDYGRRDKKGRITVVAKGDEVIVKKDGRRVFPRPLEEALTDVEGVVEAAVVGLADGQGGERVCALIVTSEGEDAGALRRKLRPVVRRFERFERPEIIEVTSERLPRDGSRHVDRVSVIARIVAMPSARPSTALRPRGSEALVPEVVGDTPSAPRERLSAPTRGGTPQKGPSRPVKAGVKQALLGVQMGFYEKGLNVRVYGKNNIPHNRQCIVVSNHASHLDMGLIKYALGSYGRDIVTLAAKDYFFEGKWRRAYFENFTNLRPFDRGDSPRETMREASALLKGGHNVLVFPEGTRTTTGELGDFRAAFTYLAMKHGVDILPVYLDGTYRSMPRKAFFPKNRNVSVHIGSPIDAKAMFALTEEAGLRMSTACQKAAKVVQTAVEALRDDKTFALERQGKALLGLGDKNAAPIEVEANPLDELFNELRERFVPAEVKAPASFYFSLGAGPEGKWSVAIDNKACEIKNEKPEGGADCVMKTDVGMFTRIVREHYIPQVNEFLDGTVKTNDPELLMAFVSAFNL